MICEFCECELPVVAASNDRDCLFDIAERIENRQGSRICLDLDDCCIYEFWRTESIQPVDGYKHLCKKCACKLDAFGSLVLEDDCQRRVKNARNTANNILNANANRDIPLYMVAFDIAIKDHPVAQISRKEGDRIVMTNMVHGESVGHLLKYMEGR